MAKTTECPQENVGAFHIRARQGQGVNRKRTPFVRRSTDDKGGRHIRTFPRNSGRRGKYMLKEESNGAYSPNTKSKSSGRSGITKLKTNQISPFAEQRRDQAEIVTDLGTIPPTLHNIWINIVTILNRFRNLYILHFIFSQFQQNCSQLVSQLVSDVYGGHLLSNRMSSF